MYGSPDVLHRIYIWYMKSNSNVISVDVQLVEAS